MPNISKITFLILSVFALAVACKDKEEDSTPIFEKKEIMQQLADTWIQPGYLDFQSQLIELEQEWTNFGLNPNAGSLQSLQNVWKECYLSFERIKMFDFGPAADLGFAAAIGTFPSDTTSIKNNISSGVYDLQTIGNIAAIGLPAMDYLFFKNDALNELSSEVNRQTYVSNLIQKMKSEINALVSAWASYKSTFVEGTGNSSTSPFSLLVNAFCKDFELAKNAKVGIPIGKQSLGIQRPEYLEAPYSAFGKELIKENFLALKAIYLGNGLNGESGKGFDDYLIALEKNKLSQTIEERFNFLVANPDSWSGSMENMMQSNPGVLDAYYEYMQGTIVYLKADMASAFGILITYQDNDGD